MATGTSQEVFHSVGTFSWVRLRLKRWARVVDSCLAQVLSAFGLIPSGSAARLGGVSPPVSSHFQ